jgi:hypothetical protein
MRWEYKTVKIKATWTGNLKQELIEEELNALGRQDWELVNILHSQSLGESNWVLAVFKKPL